MIAFRRVAASLAFAAAAALPIPAPCEGLEFGTDAALRLEDDSARFAFVLFDRFDGGYHESLNLAAKSPTPEIALEYLMVSGVSRLGAGRATLRDGKGGLDYANAFTAHMPAKCAGFGYVAHLEADLFAGLVWKADGASGKYPAAAKGLRIASGKTASFAFTLPCGRTWTVAFPRPVPFILNDLRAAGGRSFELRVLAQDVASFGKAQQFSCKCLFSRDDGKFPKSIRGFDAIAAGEAWVKLNWLKGVKASSAFDFSRGPHRRAPAGSDGWLVADGERLRFAHGSSDVRLFGATLSGRIQLASKTAAQNLAKRLVRTDYNSVRLTGIEPLLFGANPAADELDRKAAEKFDVFVQVMEGEGLCVFREAMETRVSGWERFAHAPVNGAKNVSPTLANALFLCHDPAHSAWKMLMERSYLRKNLKSAKLCCDDPGAPIVATSMGGGLFPCWRDLQAMPFFAKGYSDWLADHRAADPDFMRGAVCEPLDLGVIALSAKPATSVRRYLAERETEGLRRERDYLAANKGRALFAVKPGAPDFLGEADARTEAADLVLLDFAIDHPRRIGDRDAAVYRVENDNPFARKFPIPVRFARYAELKKPFGLAGWSLPPPSPYRAAMGLYLGAVASRDGWDCIWRDGYASDAGQIAEGKGAPLQGGYMNDPFVLASERAVFALFVRGDFATNGKLDLRDGALTVTCDRTAGGFSPLATGAVTAGPLTALLSGSPAAVWASAIDTKGRSLAETNRILLFHLTELQREGTLYADSRHRLVMSNGGGAALVRAGKAEISLAVGNAKGWKVYALKCDGGRANPVPVSSESGTLKFTADVNGASGAQFAYELIRN